MKFLLIHTLILFSVFTLGCDIIAPPFVKNATINPTPEKVQRKILLEEYTGHYCTFCPKGHAEAGRLKSIYGDKLITVAIHANEQYAKPLLPDYPDDFRTVYGNQLYTDFQSPGQPAGVINRKKANDSTVSYSKSYWAELVSREDSLTADISIKPTCTFNATTKEITLNVDIQFIKDLPQNTNLIVYILEDSVKAPQLNNSIRVPDYIHRDMLRDMPLGAYGQQITFTPSKSETTVSKNIKYSFANKNWDISQCKIVIAVAVNNGLYKDILQVEELRVIQ